MRSANFRSALFSLEIAISMGLKSGLYGGRYRTGVFPGQDFRHSRAFVSLEIVEHDDVAFLQSRQEMVLEPGFERLGVHGVVVGLGRDDASQAQAEYEGDRFVMPMRNTAAQTLAAPAPAEAARHAGRRRRLIDEHQFQRIEIELTVEPSPSPLKDVRAALLTRVRGLFLNVMSWRSKKRQIIDGDTFSPRARSRRSQISLSVRSGSRR